MSLYKMERVIDVSDWDQLVTETYGRPYSFQQQDDCKPRGREHLQAMSDPDLVYDFEAETVPEVVNGPKMGVSFAAWLARDPSQKIPSEGKFGCDFTDLWWDRNFYPTAESVAHDLVKRGLLEEGAYTIDIDW